MNLTPINMKPSLLTILLISTTMCIAQKDSVYIKKVVDDMEDKFYLSPSRKIVVKSTEEKKAIVMYPFIENDLTIKDLYVKVIGVGSCDEEDELIIMFSDSTKTTLKQWNEFTCDGSVYMTIPKQVGIQLAEKRILKIKYTNGRSFDSLTKAIDKEDSDYFIQVYLALNSRNVKEIKK